MSLFIITAKIGDVAVYVTAAVTRDAMRERAAAVVVASAPTSVDVAHWENFGGEWKLVETYLL